MKRLKLYCTNLKAHKILTSLSKGLLFFFILLISQMGYAQKTEIAVTLYGDAKCDTGSDRCELKYDHKKGGSQKYDVLNDTDGDSFHNEASSIIVNKGYMVKLYNNKYPTPSDDDFLVLYEGKYDHLYAWNDEISAAVVEVVPENTPLAKFYDDWWEGNYQCLGPGKYHRLNLLDNDIITTAQIDKGLIITVYDNNDKGADGAWAGSGTSKIIMNTDQNKGKINIKDDLGMNDEISFIEIKRSKYKLTSIVPQNITREVADKFEAIATALTCSNIDEGGSPIVDCGVDNAWTKTKSTSISMNTNITNTLTISSETNVEGSVLVATASESMSIENSTAISVGMGKTIDESEQVAIGIKCETHTPKGYVEELVVMGRPVKWNFELVYTYEPEEPGAGEPYKEIAYGTIKTAIDATCVNKVIFKSPSLDKADSSGDKADSSGDKADSSGDESIKLSSVDRIEDNKFYRLTNAWMGDGRSLDVDPNTMMIRMAPTGNNPGQFWQITAQGNGIYKLSCLWQGEGKAIDVVNDGANDRMSLANIGKYSGQSWRIEYVGDGYYRFINGWQSNKSLDCDSDKNGYGAFLNPTGTPNGQLWKISPI